MDRLDHQGTLPWSAPGLLPGVVGALMIVFAAVLGVQLQRPAPPYEAASEAAGDAPGGPGERGEWSGLRAAALAALLCVAFAGIALGHGWPFEFEAAVFVLAFTATFSWQRWRREGRAARSLAIAAAVALVAAVAISALFERVFLVRLP